MYTKCSLPSDASPSPWTELVSEKSDVAVSSSRSLATAAASAFVVAAPPTPTLQSAAAALVEEPGAAPPSGAHGAAGAGDVCLDVDATAPTIRVEAYACNDDFHNGDNERWDFDQATGIVSSRLFGSETSCMMAC